MRAGVVLIHLSPFKTIHKHLLCINIGRLEKGIDAANTLRLKAVVDGNFVVMASLVSFLSNCPVATLLQQLAYWL